MSEARIKQLEAQIRVLQNQMDDLRKLLGALIGRVAQPISIPKK